MSSLRQNSNSLKDQKTESNEQYKEVGHVTDSIDHGCVQAYDSILDSEVSIVEHFGKIDTSSSLKADIRPP